MRARRRIGLVQRAWGWLYRKLGNRGEDPFIVLPPACVATWHAVTTVRPKLGGVSPSESRGNGVREHERPAEGPKPESHAARIPDQVCLQSPHSKYYQMPRGPAMCFPKFPLTLSTSRHSHCLVLPSAPNG